QKKLALLPPGSGVPTILHPPPLTPHAHAAHPMPFILATPPASLSASGPDSTGPNVTRPPALCARQDSNLAVTVRVCRNPCTPGAPTPRLSARPRVLSGAVFDVSLVARTARLCSLATCSEPSRPCPDRGSILRSDPQWQARSSRSRTRWIQRA